MADEIEVRVERGEFDVVGDRVYTEGETLTVDAAVADAHPRTLTVLDDAPPEDTAESEPADASTESADADKAEEGAAPGAFDAASFVDDSWQSVTAAIDDGEVDEHLDAVREAEEARDSPRDSVLNALDERAD